MSDYQIQNQCTSSTSTSESNEENSSEELNKMLELKRQLELQQVRENTSDTNANGNGYSNDDADAEIVQEIDNAIAEARQEAAEEAMQEAAEEAAEEAEEAALQKKLEEHVADANNNLNIFLTWITQNLNESDIYKLFSENFTSEYRVDLYENICEFFNDESMVSDDILFYWKFIVTILMKSSKKYKSYLGDLIFDLDTHNTNMVLVREKHIFRCFIADEPICYFKENGSDYYVS